MKKLGDNIIEVVWENKLDNFSEMFKKCYSLVSIDLSNIDITNVKDMGNTFYGYFSLKSLDLSNFNTANFEDIWGLFYGC